MATDARRIDRVYSTKPTLLAPLDNGGHAHIADLHLILADTKMIMRKDELLGVTDNEAAEPASMVVDLSALGQRPASPTHTLAISQTGTASTISAGPSVSVVGSQITAHPPGSMAGSMAPSNTSTLLSTPLASQIYLERGSLLQSCTAEGNGDWFGNVWSGPSDGSYSLPPNTSPCQLCANTAIQHKYCFHTAGSCTHSPLLGSVLSPR